MPTPTYTPTPSPTATHTPTPTPTLTPIATPAQGYQIVTRDQEYAYAIDIPEDWTLWWGGYMHKSRSFQQGRLVISAVNLADGTGLERFAQSVRDGLRRNWHTASLFEIKSFERTQIGDHDAYAIAYQVQKSPEYCVLDVVEVVVAASFLPGNPQAFRAKYSLSLCEGQYGEYQVDDELGEVRTQTLDSFRVVTRPSVYYTQFVFAHGITVKASSAVAPEALVKAAESITRMTVGLRHDIRTCLVREGAAMAIHPKDGFVVELPEFAHGKGEFDDYQGGIGAIPGQPVSATYEGDLLQNRGAHSTYITVHEFAHAVMNLCFTQEDIAEVTELYDDALRDNVFPGSYAMSNVDEFFAQLSVAYLSSAQVQDALRMALPETSAFMERVYGDPLPLPYPTPAPLLQDVNRVQKYAYSIEIPEDWRQFNLGDGNKSYHSGGVYRYLNEGSLSVQPVDLAHGTTLEHFAQSVRDEPLGEWWSTEWGYSAPLFEITSFERTLAGDLDAYSIAYRVWQGSYSLFFYDAVEIVVVASSMPDNPQGFRARYVFDPWMGDYRALRTRVLDSFRVFAE